MLSSNMDWMSDILSFRILRVIYLIPMLIYFIQWHQRFSSISSEFHITILDGSEEPSA